MRIASIARERRMPESSVRTIVKRQDQIKELASRTSHLSHSTVVTRTRTYSMETMEKMLLTWIEDSQKQNMPLSSLRIKAQARAFYQKIKSEKTDLTEVEINETFNASQGWFYRFKGRTGLGNIQLISEKDSPDAEDWRIYQCDLCGIKMTSSNNLANHRKCVHEGTRNHTCETCGKSFAYPGDLRKHNTTTHENETLIP